MDVSEASSVSRAVTSLDAGTPRTAVSSSLSGPLIWSGADYEDEDSYACQLGTDDVGEIDAALERFKTLGLDGEQVGRLNFPLPNLEPRLFEGATAVHQGRGFFLVRGLDASKYSVEDSIIIFLAVASYVADQRGLQDRKGNVLSHIIDSKLWTVPVEQRHGIHSRSALPFHNDMGCDILALQVRHGAKSGGHTYLSSVWTAFNQLIEEDPSTISTLMAPEWPVQISGRKAQYYLAPAITIHQGKLLASLDPSRFGPHPVSESMDIPSLTTAQQRALEAISKTAHQNELDLRLKTGDMLFFNNWSLLHRRDSYVDGDDSSRHMIRLWLRSTDLGWAVPESMMPPWMAAYGDQDAKIRKGLYPLVPMPEYKAPRYSAGSAAFSIEDSDSSSCDERE